VRQRHPVSDDGRAGGAVDMADGMIKRSGDMSINADKPVPTFKMLVRIAPGCNLPFRDV
jgi:hypothetical protein